MKQFTNDEQAAHAMAQAYAQLKKEIGKVIVGQEETVKFVLISVFSGGHALLVGVPGLAKTLLVNTISDALGLSFNRIQFTPDLMPSDIVGAEIIDEDRKFKFMKGPLFTNVLLADEINRTPPKTQAALLEAMQEKSVTAAGHTHKLDDPFFVLATQNPIEQEGTYPLPEAQLDRFMFNIWLDYPSFEEEVAVVKSTTSNQKVEVNSIVGKDEILAFQELVRKVPVADSIYEYAVGLVAKTRPNTQYASELVNEFISWGAGPRASQYLILAAKCHAILNDRYSPEKQDIQAVALPILRHRVVRTYRAEAEGYTVEKILESLF